MLIKTPRGIKFPIRGERFHLRRQGQCGDAEMSIAGSHLRLPGR